MKHVRADDATPEQVEHERAVHEPLARVLRDLGEASVLTEVDDDVVAGAVADLRDVLARLDAHRAEGSYGVRRSSHGITRTWGNAAVGLRNPVAPPLVVHRDPEGRSHADITLGATYEGPTGLVHGGVSALLLDQLLGEASGAGRRPGMTARLDITYRRPTPLGRPLRGEAAIERTEGRKTWVRGHIADDDGVCVEAVGLFIRPRWADASTPEQDPDRFE